MYLVVNSQTDTIYIMGLVSDFLNEDKRKEEEMLRLNAEREAQARRESETFAVESVKKMQDIVVPTLYKIANELNSHGIPVALNRRVYFPEYEHAEQLTSLTLDYKGYKIQVDAYAEVSHKHIEIDFYRQNQEAIITGLGTHGLARHFTILETTEEKIEETFRDYLKSL